MLLIADANVLYSFFKRESAVKEIVLFSDIKYNLQLVAPIKLFEELDKHKSEICEKAKISEEEFEFPRRVLETFIQKIPDESWQDFKSKAEELLQKHIKDVPYVALVLYFKDKNEKPSLGSNEDRLKVLEKLGIEVFKTDKLIKYLKSLGFKF